MDIVFVGIGGLLGSIARYLVARSVSQAVGDQWFPYGTLAVNAVGCLVIGFLAGLADTRGFFAGNSRVFLFAGVLGGFTTFSSFSLETLTLVRNGYLLGAMGNVVAQVVLGMAGVWAGYAIGRAL